MVDASKNEFQENSTRSNQPLEVKDKLYFAMCWWGVHSWGHLSDFKTNGYSQRYREAKRAMFTGAAVYGFGILLFIIVLVYF